MKQKQQNSKTRSNTRKNIRKAKKIVHRKPNFKFSPDLERYWLGGSVFKTHLLNSFTLIFPIGERYFIRSIKKVLKNVSDNHLLEEAQGFIQQEAQHALEHGRFLQILRQQGLKFDVSINAVEYLIEKILEPLNGPALNLAVTSGLEHLTALLAEISLSENFLKDAPPEVRDLYNWHAAEEIEHRAVAFDVLKASHPNFVLRLIGLVYAYAILGGLSAFLTTKLIAQDGKVLDKEVWGDFLNTFLFKEKLFFKAVSIFADYIAPDFHPLNVKLDDLAGSVFEEQIFFAGGGLSGAR